MKKILLLSLFVNTLMGINCFADNPGDRLQFDRPNLAGSGCPMAATTAILSPDAGAITILFDQFQVALPQTQGDNDNTSVTELNPKGEDRFDSLRDHKVCDILINTQLPKQAYLESITVTFDFRGYSFVDPGAMGSFRSMIYPEKQKFHLLKLNSVIAEKTWSALAFPRRPRPNGPDRDHDHDDRNHDGHRRFFNRPAIPAGESTPIDTDWTLQAQKLIPLQKNCENVFANNRNYQSLQLHLRNMIMAEILPTSIHANPLPQASITLDSIDVGQQMKIQFNIKPCPIHL